MATYRQFKPSFWNDFDVIEYPSDYKLLFIYLFTNKNMTESGIYPFSTYIASIETKLPEELIKEILTNLKNVIYDSENKCVFIKNYRRHSTIGGSKVLMEKSIKNDFKATYKSPLWHYFLKEYPECEKIINNGNCQLSLNTEVILDKGLETVSKGLDKGLETVSKGLDKGLDLATKNDTDSNPLERVVKPLNSSSSRNSISCNSSITTLKGDKIHETENPYELLKTNLTQTKNPVAYLLDIFNKLNGENKDATFGWMGRVCKLVNNNYEVVLKSIWKSGCVTTDGSKKDYVYSIVLGESKKMAQNQPERPMKTTKDFRKEQGL